MAGKKSTIHIETPLIFSSKLSAITGEQVYLKLENTQPTGAFKLRGNGFHSQKEVERGCKRLITASGGNTGMAVARSGQVLQVPVTIFIPTSSPPMVIDLLREQGAEVEVFGDNFGQANAKAVEVAKQPGNSYIHPYYHEETWEGHSTMVDEMKIQLGDKTPGCFIVSVGGGGLLQGLLAGMKRNGWEKVPVVAVETKGADCLSRAIDAGKPVELREITSVAVTLGAMRILPQVFDEMEKYKVISRVVTDSQAVESCIRFADDHRMLVEPACGAALAMLYCDLLKNRFPQGINGPVVLIVCGGAGVNISLLQKWAEQFNLDFPYKEK